MSSLFSQISIALEEILKNKDSKITPLSSDFYPLSFLLTLNQNLIGFAILEKPLEESFSKAFQRLKDLYSIHSNEWADFDVALVFCSPNSEEISFEFCSKIETDPYFCRKFVIDSSKDLKSELGRLPFLPLYPEAIVGLKRPLSAQTLLMKHNVASELANYLAVPHTRGIDGIIDECITGILGKTEWSEIKIGGLVFPHVEVSRRVRLKNLEISNFRAYRGNHKFDFDADLVVVYGANGLGKTSLFDAIDFLTTGSVARFDERYSRRTDRLQNILKHLDASIEDSFVNGTLLVDGKEVLLKRNMDDRTQAEINNNIKDRTQALMELTGLLEEPLDLRIENLVRLFRATHLFGQEFQSLTTELMSLSKLPEDTVSRMLAFQDYVEAIGKSRKVSEELERRINDKQSVVVSLNNSLKSQEEQSEQLRKTAKLIEKPEVISKMGKEIIDKIAIEFNMPMEIPAEFKTDIIHGWRGMIAAKKEKFNRDFKNIEEIESKFTKFSNFKIKLQDKTTELALKIKSLVEFEESGAEIKNKLVQSNAQLKEKIREESALSSRRENLNWLIQTKVEYGKINGEILNENKIIKDMQKELLVLLPKIEVIKSENIVEEKFISKISSEIEFFKNRLKAVDDLESNLENWLKTIKSYEKVKKCLSEIQKEIKEKDNGLKIKEKEVSNLVMLEKKLKANLSNLQRFQSELKSLLDGIEKHITDKICPVCGAFHKSKEDLREKLKKQQGIQPEEIKKALNEIEQGRTKIIKLQKSIADLELQKNQIENSKKEALAECLYIEETIEKYRKELKVLKIPEDYENLSTNIVFEKKKYTEEINKAKQRLLTHTRKFDLKQKDLLLFIDQQRILEQNFHSKEAKLNQLKLMGEKINREAVTRQVQIDLEEGAIREQLNMVKTKIESLRDQIRINQNEAQNFQKDFNGVMEKKNIVESSRKELEKEIGDLKEYCDGFVNLIGEFNLNSDIDSVQIGILKNSITNKMASLDILQNRVIDFEIALDATQTSASLARIQQEIENIKKQTIDLRVEFEQLKQWKEYFDIICRELESVKSQALKEYTAKYGPLTSTIQKRLRSVYGFGEIKLQPEKEGIEIRVERTGGKNISPSDYFSESQMQIVMLSLFLSATLTQTWSSFAPILLDDPVTHFDDLNAYSLVDLIKGLVDKPGKGNQFIISTCEDRLFRLMKQKFNRLDGKVIFYKFESIGESGPKITKV